jgi:tyrosinase
MSSIPTSTRREALIGGAAATALLLSPARRAWSETLTVRPDIASPAGTKMADLYSAAVKAMQDPAINYPPQPQSWTFQAYMHAVPLNPFDPAVCGGVRGPALKPRVDDIYGHPAAGTPQAAWKQAALQCWATCQHASPYFTTWHRWYLHYFERICRKMCGHPEFALPYWNYASDNGPSLQLPAQFQAASSDPLHPNPLYFDDRGPGYATAQATGEQNVPMNDNGFLPYSQVRYGPALSATQMFPSDPASSVVTDPTDPAYSAFGFSGRLECAPHDNVHSYVGGWMQNVPSAAGDPIFFMHHCQIDRLYASWAAEPGTSYNWGSSPTQPDEKTWKTGKMASFVDENGALLQVTLGKAIETATLGYSYDKLAAPPAPEIAALTAALVAPRRAIPLTLAAMEARAFSVNAGGSTVTLAPAIGTETATPGAAPRGVRETNAQTLVLSGIKLLRRPPAPLSVFVNMPKGTAPRLHNPYYAGTLNLFNFDLGTGAPMDHEAGEMPAGHAMPGATARFDVTEILRRQRAEGLWDGGPVSITISTIGADAAGSAIYLTLESASIVP